MLPSNILEMIDSKIPNRTEEFERIHSLAETGSLDEKDSLMLLLIFARNRIAQLEGMYRKVLEAMDTSGIRAAVNALEQSANAVANIDLYRDG